MGLMDEIKALMLKRAEHVAAIHKIDTHLADVRMVMNTRQPTNSKRGRPDVSSERITAALSIREPMNSSELRIATGIKKTTLEAALRKLSDAGEIIRNPTEWKGPNGNYLYARTADIFEGTVLPASHEVAIKVGETRVIPDGEYHSVTEMNAALVDSAASGAPEDPL